MGRRTPQGKVQQAVGNNLPFIAAIFTGFDPEEEYRDVQ